MTTQKRQFGDLGEYLACRFLMKRGYTIVETNYLKTFGEIDIVARRWGTDRLHFIEVKAVSHVTDKDGVSRETIMPEENMHAYKIQRFSRAIEMYLVERKISHETSFQVDLITVRIDHKRRVGRVEMLENVF